MQRLRSSTAAWLSVYFFYAVLANLPFWVASSVLGIWCHGIFCLEYALLGIVALFIPGWLAAVFLLITFLADILSGISETYFLSPSECLTSSVFLSEFSSRRLFAIAAVLLFTVIVALIAARLPANRLHSSVRRRAILALLAFSFACLFADYTTIVRGAGHLINPLRASTLADGVHPIYFRGIRIARPITLRLVRNEIFYDRIRISARKLPDPSPAPSAAAIAMKAAGIPLSGTAASTPENLPNIVLVLVESWGDPVNTALSHLLLSDYDSPQLQSRYQVLTGSVPFFGSTVAGESRELCSSHMNLYILNASHNTLATCLPQQLAHLGYHSVAVHGMDGHMFDRVYWYPRIGFDDQWFRERFRLTSTPECIGAFTASCDGNLAAWIGNRLTQTSVAPEFIYWVTINSHLPVPTPATVAHPIPCTLPILAEQPDLCSWAQLVANVHHSIAQAATQMQTAETHAARPTIFILVGDHAPPFVSPTLRSQFSSSDVPYIILLPRTLAH